MNAGIVQKKPERIYQMQHRFYLDFPDSLTKYFVLKVNYNKKYVICYKTESSYFIPVIYMGTLHFFVRF
jgi:hypothetical protein